MKKRNWQFIVRVSLALLFGSILVIGIISYSNTIKPKGIVIHHSAIPLPKDETVLDAKLIDEIHRRRGFGIFCWGQTYYIGYHYIILPDETIQRGRPETCRGAHTQGYNESIGICLIGDFSLKHHNGESGAQKPTAEQMNALTKLTKLLRFKYDISLSNIYLHKELNSKTECPGADFPTKDFYERVF